MLLFKTIAPSETLVSVERERERERFLLISNKNFRFNVAQLNACSAFSAFPVVVTASCVVDNAPEKTSFFSQVGEGALQVVVPVSYGDATASCRVTNFSKISALFSSVGDNAACGDKTFASGNHKNKHFLFNLYINNPKS